MKAIKCIQNKIYTIRGQLVVLDFDLAELYGVELEIFEQAVKRHEKRLPIDFMFVLSCTEWEEMQLQFPNLRLIGNKNTIPVVFTGKGMLVLSCFLNSDKAIKMSVSIIRFFMSVQLFGLQQFDSPDQVNEIHNYMAAQDPDLNKIFNLLENMLYEDSASQ